MKPILLILLLLSACGGGEDDVQPTLHPPENVSCQTTFPTPPDCIIKSK